jgi:hypothetical protein
MASVRDQAERISRCRLSFQIKQGNRPGLVNQHILDTSMFIEDDNPQGGLFVEKAVLSQSFFDELKKHPVPVEEAAVRQIANNSVALDVYCWLAYRLHSLHAPITVSWKALHSQFGRSVARIDHFKDHFRTALGLAMSVYPDACVDEADNGIGLVLKPSKPPVAPRQNGTGRLRLIPGTGSRQISAFTPDVAAVMLQFIPDPTDCWIWAVFRAMLWPGCESLCFR